MQEQRMTPAAWQRTEQLAREAGLGDAEMAGLAIGCPVHGNVSMDFDDDGVFCHACDRETTAARRRAYELGSIDALIGREMRDMGDADSAWLMDELGETGPTTDANWAERAELCAAYFDGYQDAESAARP